MNQSALFRFYGLQIVRTGEYHGWRAAETVSSVEEEYTAARTRVACFDSSFRGRLRVSGKDGLDLLHRLSTNDLLGLRPGGSVGTVLTTEKGRIVDFVTVFHGGDSLMLLVSPLMEEAVISWVRKFTILEDVSIKSITDETVMASFIGPESNSFISSILQIHSLREATVSLPWGNVQVVPVRVSRETELHIVAHSANAERFWTWLQDACSVQKGVESPRRDGGVPLVGSSAYEAYRIAEGIPMAATELVQDYNPYDVNLKDFISYTKGCYIGQEVIARLETYQKARRRMAGLIFESGNVGSPSVVMAGGEEVGRVTSFTREPLFGACLGLAVLRSEAIIEGAPVTCVSESGDIRASIHELPMGWPRA